MSYQHLVDTYETERLKVLSVWSMFGDADLGTRPHPSDRRGRSVREHMVHQCVSEDIWFRTMLGVDVSAPPLPDVETRLEFIRRYALDSERRLEVLRQKTIAWWETEVPFFDVTRSRAWVMTRRIVHTAHHRGQQTTLLRILGRAVYSTYGPTADTGGLLQDRAPTIYPYGGAGELLAREGDGGHKAALPVPPQRPLTERPQD